jgi:hypothetical protein
MLTQARLKELMTYDASTGVFARVKSVQGSGRNVSNQLNRDGYLVFNIDRKTYLRHRLAWLYVHGVFPDGHIDHINRVKTDNRICNLRVVTAFESNQNIPPVKNDLYPNVHWAPKKNKFMVRMRSARKEYRKYFASLEDAKRCSDEMRRKYKPLFTAIESESAYNPDNFPRGQK